LRKIELILRASDNRDLICKKKSAKAGFFFYWSTDLVFMLCISQKKLKESV